VTPFQLEGSFVNVQFRSVEWSDRFLYKVFCAFLPRGWMRWRETLGKPSLTRFWIRPFLIHNMITTHGVTTFFSMEIALRVCSKYLNSEYSVERTNSFTWLCCEPSTLNLIEICREVLQMNRIKLIAGKDGITNHHFLTLWLTWRDKQVFDVAWLLSWTCMPYIENYMWDSLCINLMCVCYM
jgi:hypothetical protein